MKGYKFREKWTANHTKTFLVLKAKLISEPVLSAPQYDGTPFILTTDRCVDAVDVNILFSWVSLVLSN